LAVTSPDRDHVKPVALVLGKLMRKLSVLAP
jgi:hypothetical protein